MKQFKKLLLGISLAMVGSPVLAWVETVTGGTGQDMYTLEYDVAPGGNVHVKNIYAFSEKGRHMAQERLARIIEENAVVKWKYTIGKKIENAIGFVGFLGTLGCMLYIAYDEGHRAGSSEMYNKVVNAFRSANPVIIQTLQSLPESVWENKSMFLPWLMSNITRPAQAQYYNWF